MWFKPTPDAAIVCALCAAAFHQLKTPVEKSDAWRYHVLCGHGGIYADTDTVCAHPFDTWVNFNSTPEPGLIVGIENRFYSQEVRLGLELGSRTAQSIQWLAQTPELVP